MIADLDFQLNLHEEFNDSVKTIARGDSDLESLCGHWDNRFYQVIKKPKMLDAQVF